MERGSDAALDQTDSVVYRELRQRARNYLRRERPDHTSQPTALINEVYLRLVSDKPENWQDRAHFMAVASRVMRQIPGRPRAPSLPAEARQRRCECHPGRSADPAQTENTDILALDEALSRLAEVDERKCRIIEMRYFGGCTVEEAAEALGIAAITVIRETRVAKHGSANPCKANNLRGNRL
jgi:RNA polymerase sigma factor (TIGR02999 family)